MTGKKQYEPTPDEIREACERIRAGWSEHDYRHKTVQKCGEVSCPALVSIGPNLFSAVREATEHTPDGFYKKG